MPPRTDATLVATGDAILTRPLPPTGPASPSGDLAGVLHDAEATVVHLECVVPDEGTYATPFRAVPDQYRHLASFPGTLFRGPPAVVDDLAALGTDVVTLASNHALDYGRAGLTATVRRIRDRGMAPAGAGESRAAAGAPAYHETAAGRVAVVQATTGVPPGGEAGAATDRLPPRPGVNPLHFRWVHRVTADQLDALREVAEATGIADATASWRRREHSPGTDDPDYRFMHMGFRVVDDPADVGIGYEAHEPDREALLDAVRAGRRNADWVVVGLHAHHGPGGIRNVPETPSAVRAVARDCVDAGADAFVGTGPHVVRGVETYRDRPLCYSLGNFADQRETVDRLPPESYRYYGVDPDADPSAVFDRATVEERDSDRWESVVLRLRLAADGPVRAEFLPVTLGPERSRGRRGTPERATGDEGERTLDRLVDRSDPFGTRFDRGDGVATVALGDGSHNG
ncbi:MAG: CapA family protein [Haloferacaceae archaeon]